MPELMVTLAILGMVLVLAVGGGSEATDRAEALAGAHALAGEIRQRRMDAVSSGRTLGLRFGEHETDGWSLTLVEDGDGDGIRSDDVEQGRDRVLGRRRPIASLPCVLRPGFAEGLTSLRSPPPVPRPLGPLVRPLRLSGSETITFNPSGKLTSGTIYLTDGKGMQCAVVVNGTAGRVRIFELDRRMLTWVQR